MKLLTVRSFKVFTVQSFKVSQTSILFMKSLSELLSTASRIINCTKFTKQKSMMAKAAGIFTLFKHVGVNSVSSFRNLMTKKEALAAVRTLRTILKVRLDSCTMNAMDCFLYT